MGRTTQNLQQSGRTTACHAMVGQPLTWTCRHSLSAVEYTATVLSPSSLQARITRTAISPRLAISTFLISAVGGVTLLLVLLLLLRAVSRVRFKACWTLARDCLGTNSPASPARKSLLGTRGACAAGADLREPACTTESQDGGKFQPSRQNARSCPTCQVHVRSVGEGWSLAITPTVGCTLVWPSSSCMVVNCCLNGCKLAPIGGSSAFGVACSRHMDRLLLR